MWGGELTLQCQLTLKNLCQLTLKNYQAFKRSILGLIYLFIYLFRQMSTSLVESSTIRLRIRACINLDVLN